MTYLGNPPVNGVFKKLDNISGSFNGTTTTFNLTSGGAATTPGLAQNLIISLGGIIQEPGSAFTISGSTITFTAAPASYVSFWGIQLGDVGLATNPNQSAMTTQTFTATASQVTFTVAGGYTAGQLQVFQNGVQLVVGTDVTASNGTTFVLTNAANSGDTLVAISYSSFIVGNAVAKSGDTMSGDLTVPNFTYTGTLTGSTGVMNIGSGQLYKDASGNVGIGTATPNANTGTALVLYSTNTPRFRLTNSTTGQAAGDGSEISLFSTGELIIENRESAATIFYNGGSERARINSSGTFLFNRTTLPSLNGICALTYDGSTTQGFVFTNSANSQNGAAIRFVDYLGNFSGGGIYYTSSNSITYATSSDYRLKENVQPLASGLATVSALKPVSYTWKVDGAAGEGFIAHELQKLVPLAVAGEKDAVDAEGNMQPQAVDYSKIVVHLVAAIQELTARVAELEGK